MFSLKCTYYRYTGEPNECVRMRCIFVCNINLIYLYQEALSRRLMEDAVGKNPEWEWRGVVHDAVIIIS